ncbi:MAG: VWA domain-containing protein [Acidobacteria bacterium]|nr:VWA domain-containing protein [Acidobacteriota bacterium]
MDDTVMVTSLPSCLVRLLLASCALLLPVPGLAQQAVFRGDGDTVRVFVTVTDRDGRLVTTLAQSDFEIRDNGRPQPIAIFDSRPQPIQLVVMLDVSGSMLGNLQLLRESAARLFASLLPGDRVRVGTFGREIEISPTFTNDIASLTNALPTSIAADAPTPLWRAIDQAMAAFDDTDDARRVVLVLSDGRDGASLSFGGRPVSQVQVIDTARDRDVMVYAIGMRSRGGRAAPAIGVGRAALQSSLAMDMPDPGLARVAQDTGGGYFELRASEDLGAAFARVADELHRQYLIGFAVPERDGKVHEIDVRVSTRGQTPRARKDYVAPREPR